MIWDSSRQENSGIPVVSFNSLGIVSPPFSKSPEARLDLTLEEGRLWRVKEFGITLERGATSSLFVTFRHLLSPLSPRAAPGRGWGGPGSGGGARGAFPASQEWKMPGKHLGNAWGMPYPGSAPPAQLVGSVCPPSPSDNPRATAVGRDVLADF